MDVASLAWQGSTFHLQRPLLIQYISIYILDILNDSETHKETYMKEESGPAKKRAFIALQRSLVKCQELGDEKLHLLTVMNELIENRTRQLEQDRENLGKFIRGEPALIFFLLLSENMCDPHSIKVPQQRTFNEYHSIIFSW